MVEFELLDHQKMVMEQYMGHVPSAGLPADSTQEERIAKIFEVQPNHLKQLVDRVRESCPAIFKSANKTLENAGVPRDLPRATRNGHLAEVIFCNPKHRLQLFKRYQELTAKGSRNAELPPVVEFELIKAWNPEYDITGDSIPGLVYAQEGDNLTLQQINLHPTFVAPLLGNVPSLTVRTKLTLIGDQILKELTQEEDMPEEDIALAAGVVFAVSSLGQSPFIQSAFLRLFPFLAPYIGPKLKPNWKEEWEKDEAQEPNYCPARRRLHIKSLGTLSCLSRFAKEPDTETLAKTKQLLASTEQLFLELGTQEAEKIKKLRSETLDRLNEAQEAYTAAGAPLGLQAVYDRIDAWESVLKHELMQHPSDARTELVSKLLSEVKDFHNKANIILDYFTVVRTKREAAMDSNQSWTKQAELMQEVAQLMQKTQDDVCDFSDHVRQLPDFVLKVPKETIEPASEPDSVQPCPDEWAAEMTQLEHYWKDQVNEANERIDELRQDNATLKNQVDALKLSLTNPEPTCSTLPPELVAYAETMATNGNVHDVLRLIQVLYPDRVEILPSAFESSKSLTNVPIAKLHTVLKAMATAGLDQVRTSGQIIDCETLVPCGVSVQESESVRNNGKLRKERAFRYNGKQHYFYPHLRVGYGLRVYFDYFPEEQRFVVAYVGGHLSSDKSPTV